MPPTRPVAKERSFKSYLLGYAGGLGKVRAIKAIRRRCLRFGVDFFGAVALISGVHDPGRLFIKS